VGKWSAFFPGGGKGKFSDKLLIYDSSFSEKEREKLMYFPFLMLLDFQKGITYIGPGVAILV
jgi:hypothetical protein